MLINYYKHLNRSKFTFDFIVHGERVEVLEESFAKMGSQIYHAPPKKSSFIKNLAFIESVIRNGNYDVVHAHQNLSSFAPLVFARLHGVPVRISHGHGYPSTNALLASLLKVVGEVAANHYFACTGQVGQWMFPHKWKQEKTSKFIMTNAFELDHYKYTEKSRQNWRKNLHLGSFPTIIQIGRLSAEKNHSFTLSLLKELRNHGPWQLLIVGEGELLESLKRQAKELGVSENVQFLGYQADIRGLLSAADVAVMPSLSEGLGLAAIEAQVANLKVVAASSLPNDVKVSENIQFLDLNLSSWTQEILTTQFKNTNRVSEPTQEMQKYNISDAAISYSQFMSKISK
ncbi:hypothetical protein APT58_02235 [Corynebacterium glutamicum]|nr:hypothetical protein APT58_02235 [Corynebacterium glutamicum]